MPEKTYKTKTNIDNQGIIKRMNYNSMFTKALFMGFSIPVFTAQILDSTMHSYFMYAYFLITITLWYIDTQYLLIERKFIAKDIGEDFVKKPLYRMLFGSFSLIMYPSSLLAVTILLWSSM